MSVRQFLSKQVFAKDPTGDDITSLIRLEESTTQQSVVADAIVFTAGLFENAIANAQSPGLGVSFFDEQKAVHTIKEGYYQPYSMGNCVLDSFNGIDDSRPVSFPIPVPSLHNPVSPNLTSSVHHLNEVPVLDYAPLRRAQLQDIEGSDSDYRLGWYELPEGYFNYSGLGAIILLPRQYNEPTNYTSQEFVACNLGAGWGSSSINVSYSENGMSATSSLINFDLSSHVGTRESDEGGAGIPLKNAYQSIVDPTLIFIHPVFPERLVIIAKDWADYLNPMIADLNTTVIDYMMKVNIGDDVRGTRPDILAKYVLNSLLTNGLARIGANFEFQGSPRLTSGPNQTTILDGTYWLSGKGDFFTVDPNESKNWTKLLVESTIEGYAYNTRGSGPKAAIAFLLTYCALALSYTIYSGISGSFP